LPQTLTNVIEYLARQPYPSEVIVVDDGSRDQTVAVTMPLTEAHANVRLIRNDHRGKGYAVRTGILAAHGHIVLSFDADSSTPIQVIEKFLPYFEDGYDIVIGSREGLGAKRIREPFYRHLMGRAFNFIVRLLTVRGIQDTQCGFKAFRDDVARAIFARTYLYRDNTPPVTGPMVTAFDVEILFLGQKLGYKIKEVPVEWRYGNESKVNPIKDSWRNLRDVLAVRWNEWRGRYNS
jgi:glycosyltransferase involved in cell wall biosynthesis